ncbi:hypothetical protein [Synechococcus elongatus]|uniref:Uncharacterized protein n=1 Tax=Synechococcus elongatus PCC 11801 TaxID=2219813 RepID=A0AAN1UTF3_SYNEL|nr:hypothetical protein [Synechococcus elongatus]AZB71476.1 hypothetical protein DOP62_00915 [Synechococcus elongatus PCC 11801]
MCHYLSIVDDSEAVQYILAKIKHLDTQDAIDLLSLIYEGCQYLFLISDELRARFKEISFRQYIQFIESNLLAVDEDTKGKLWSEISDTICSSHDFDVISQLLKLYLIYVNTQDAIKFILDKIKILEAGQAKTLLDRALEYHPSAFLESCKLHSCLRDYNFNQYMNVVQKILDNSENLKLSKTLINDLTTFLDHCSDEERSNIWYKVAYLKNNLQYRGSFWDVSPLEYKQQLITKRYSDFFELVERFKSSSYPYSQYISNNYRNLYDFDSNDKELADLWGNRTRIDFEKAKMLSARGAEKLVQYFYRNLGSNVEDLAIHQINNKSIEWKKADICISQNNLSKLIDIKNSRQTINSDIYSEFCIPEFKKNRGKDVVIAAVLSPYLKLEFMNSDGAPFKIQDPQYLGELSNSQLQSLNQDFRNDIIRLDMTRTDPKTYLPPWLFDYCSTFYQEQINIATQFLDLHEDEIPSYDDLLILNKNQIDYYIPIFIYANRSIPASWQDNVPSWKQTFIQLLYRSNKESLKLPHIFIAILRHFLIMLSTNNNSYHPNQLLYFLNLNKAVSGNDINPLKIYYPLNIVSEFCQTLSTVWNNKNRLKLTGFKIFKFDGKGLLTGKFSEKDYHPTTILAFCGGTIQGKGKCGYSPLIIGKDVNCHYCGKLICPKNDCGYCSYNCIGHKERNQRKPENSR